MPPTSEAQGPANPSTPASWWNLAKKLGLNPQHINLTTHKSHSASKFTEEDFIHLKTLWRNGGVDQLHINEHVRAEHAQALGFLLVKRKKEPGGELEHSLRQSLLEFVWTAAEPFTDDDAKNVKLGAFLLVKSNLEAIEGINNNGQVVAGDLPKIRRSARLMAQGEMAALTQQLGSMMIDKPASGPPSGPPKPPRTPSPKGGDASTPGMLATRELDVISPESMGLENNRSRDEDSVNAALVSLLDAVTLCSGIKKMGGRQGLKWHHTRQAFHLGPASNPVCEARTDGILVFGTKPEYCVAILEVKPYMRRANKLKIEWQEACQMAAWISSSLGEKNAQRRKEGLLYTGDPSKKRRVMISQDYLFLYITIAEWGRPYEEYLYGNARPPTPPSKSASPSQNRGRPDTKTAGQDQSTAGGSASLSQGQHPAQPHVSGHAAGKAAAPSSAPVKAAAPAKTSASAAAKPGAAVSGGKSTAATSAASSTQGAAQAKQASSKATAKKPTVSKDKPTAAQASQTKKAPAKQATSTQATGPSQPTGRAGRSAAAEGQAGPGPATAAKGSAAKKGAPAAATATAGQPEPGDYAAAEELDTGNFLTMNCYGPYSVRDPEHMAMFTRNVLALMLELSAPEPL